MSTDPRRRIETIGPFVFVALSDSVPPIKRSSDVMRTFSAAVSAGAGPLFRRAREISHANWKFD